MTQRAREATIRWVETFDCGGDERRHRARRRFLNLLETSPDPYDRTGYDPGHVTASAVVWCPSSDKFLFVFHRRLGRWLQPGGHVEPTDVDPWHAAQREAVEETGVDLIPAAEPVLVGIDVHDIPPWKGEPAHEHFDLAFFFQAGTRRGKASEETLRSVWCGQSDFDRYALDQATRRHIVRAIQHIRLGDGVISSPLPRESHEHGSSGPLH